MNRAVLVLCLVTTVSLSTGCAKLRALLGKGHEGDPETTTTSAGGGTITTNSTKLPDGWPSNIPAYPGANITAAMATPQGKTAVMTTKDPASKVHDFYKDKLSSMKLQSDVDLNGMKVMSFRSGSTIASITVTAAGGADTNITISIADKG